MKKIQTALILIGLLSLASCARKVESGEPQNTTPNNNVSNMNDLVVPAGFTWENSRDVNFNIGITDTRFQEAVHVVSVYDANPLAGGNLIARGSATLSTPFAAQLNLANTLKSVYIIKTSPDNSELSQEVAIEGTTVNVQLGFVVKTGKGAFGKTAGPDCSSGCTSTITTSNSNLNLNTGDVVCVTGSNISISFNANGGTLKICGSNVTVNNANLNNSSTLIVTSTASVSFSNLNQNGSSTSFQNWGTVTMGSSYSPGGSVLNNGTITTNGDYNLNTQSSQINNGIINVGQSMQVNGNTTFTNNGSVTTTQDLQVNGQGVFINNCKLWVKRDFNHSNTMQNYSYIRVDRETKVNGGAELSMYNGAMFRTLDIVINGRVKGYSNTSLVKVNGDTRINGGGEVINAIQYCDANGIETNNGTIGSGATQGCSLYVPITSCNTEGNGSAPAPTDTDGDGVSDVNDAYPNDATKAYNNYYPSATGVATVSFEDLWPSKGDYDMNDIVMTYRYNIVTNASNNVAQVIGNYTLHATGGALQNGFGVQFPIDRAKATSVTGGTLEAGQTKAVVTLFNNSRAQMATFNTVPGASASDTVNYTMSFNVTAGPSLATFGLNEYNPFIWNNTAGFGRGYEIHLPGKVPTNLANAALFGTAEDNSNVVANRYYVSTGNGLPWAISIPVKFAYPIERSDINTAYLKFATWVQSGGAQYADWYTNSTGYRDVSKVYIRP
ncbi:MAG: LruC domain-containing protein [Bacteroidota bacterium]